MKRYAANPMLYQIHIYMFYVESALAPSWQWFQIIIGLFPCSYLFITELMEIGKTIINIVIVMLFLFFYYHDSNLISITINLIFSIWFSHCNFLFLAPPLEELYIFNSPSLTDSLTPTDICSGSLCLSLTYSGASG